jgi:AbrB family looped-hinge helix DNA binding protein
MPLAKVKQKGHVTIPAEIREDVGLSVGDYVEVARREISTISRRVFNIRCANNSNSWRITFDIPPCERRNTRERKTCGRACKPG